VRNILITLDQFSYVANFQKMKTEKIEFNAYPIMTMQFPTLDEMGSLGKKKQRKEKKKRKKV
jgi:hypothetical protein